MFFSFLPLTKEFSADTMIKCDIISQLTKNIGNYETIIYLSLFVQIYMSKLVLSKPLVLRCCIFAPSKNASHAYSKAANQPSPFGLVS